MTATRRMFPKLHKSTLPVDGDTIVYDETDDVWVPGAAAGGTAAALPTDRAERTGGDVVVTESTFTLVHADLDLSIAAAEGDVLQFSINGMWSTEGNFANADLFLASSSRFVSSGTTTPRTGGVKGWGAEASHRTFIGGSVQYVVQATDVAAGVVATRLYANTSDGGDHTISASSDHALKLSVVNFGH